MKVCSKAKLSALGLGKTSWFAKGQEKLGCFGLPCLVSNHPRTAMQIMEPAVAGAPFFIQWDVRSLHPATTSPGGCVLQSLTVRSAQRTALDRLFNVLELEVVVEDGDSQDAKHRIQLSCPAGPVHLR